MCQEGRNYIEGQTIPFSWNEEISLFVVDLGKRRIMVIYEFWPTCAILPLLADNPRVSTYYALCAICVWIRIQPHLLMSSKSSLLCT